MNIIDTLRDFMKKKNLKLTHVAEATGIPYSRMHKWMAGENAPKADDTKILENYMNGAISNFAKEQEAPYKPSSSMQLPNNCMETLAKAMEVILSQQKTIESLIGNQIRANTASA